MATNLATGAATGPAFSEWNIIVAGDFTEIYLLAKIPVATFIVGMGAPFLILRKEKSDQL